MTSKTQFTSAAPAAIDLGNVSADLATLCT